MFATNDLLVGVDIHRRTNVVQVMDGAGDIIVLPAGRKQSLWYRRPGQPIGANGHGR